jgi:uncharacterized protein (DUF1778 family)
MEKLCYIKSMKKTRRGRPMKKQSDRKDKDLRIPVTAEQKDFINRAATKAGGDFAAWARDILLREAREVTARDDPNG